MFVRVTSPARECLTWLPVLDAAVEENGEPQFRARGTVGNTRLLCQWLGGSMSDSSNETTAHALKPAAQRWYLSAAERVCLIKITPH